jgi:hypothetical protein
MEGPGQRPGPSFLISKKPKKVGVEAEEQFEPHFEEKELVEAMEQKLALLRYT